MMSLVIPGEHCAEQMALDYGFALTGDNTFRLRDATCRFGFDGICGVVFVCGCFQCVYMIVRAALTSPVAWLFGKCKRPAMSQAAPCRKAGRGRSAEARHAGIVHMAFHDY